MDKSKDSQYIFWLDGWGDRSISFWRMSGQFKCIITKSKISIIPIESDPEKELNVDISLIQKCKLFYMPGNPNRSVELILSDRRIIVTPINPFEPTPVIHVNHNEVSAMTNVINAFRSNVDTEIDTNPYLRQLAENQQHKRFKGLNEKWHRYAKELDSHISPWDYYDLYGERFLWLKVVALGFVVIIVGTALIVGIAYVLDTLNII